MQLLKDRIRKDGRDKRRKRLKGGQLSDSSDGCKVISGDREGITREDLQVRRSQRFLP